MLLNRGKLVVLATRVLPVVVATGFRQAVGDRYLGIWLDAWGQIRVLLGVWVNEVSERRRCMVWPSAQTSILDTGRHWSARHRKNC